ncbi:NAD+ synthase (glutamine-hydrolysing) [Pilimelia terevasa]|uniref:Glutamine-dependent NAD(+) synthetase n=1 Tax=Pilimelia terevasa TaxID=53372 RepID=A0A8J3FHR4_9ACTN|nr:NAD+ synthase [Pilimelia terevasa]GGK26970.1 NAD+ synthase (glutamine-hydrolysing) [Pilimelia terevasa]
MPTLRLALAQVNPVVGDLAGNAALLRGAARAAAAAGAGLVLTPELGLTGYPPEDLVFRRSFVAASQAALRGLAGDLAADGLADLPVVVGYLDADGGAGLPARRRNAAALLHGGRVVARYFKHHLPNYGVFDEGRYFTPGDVLTVVRLPVGGAAVDVALTVCEDLWQAGGPFAVARTAGVGLVVSINASPFEQDKDDLRLPLVARRAAEAGAPVAYVNAVGGQDELVFDGDSMIVAADGALLARAPRFADHLLVHDLTLPAATDDPAQVPLVAPPGAALVVHRVAVTGPARAGGAGTAEGGVADRLDGTAQVWRALVVGLRDYVDKNRFPSVILGLSGGIDSSVVAALAVDALGPDRVHGVSMPSRYSSAHSRDDAADLAARTGCAYRVAPIQEMVDQFLAHLSLSGLAVENLQARVRGVLLMSLSNSEGHLVLTTGNKSELAVGYSTLYGDSVGGFNPLKDVPKTLVWELARWRNADAAARGEVPPVPENAITKPPSAELRPDQRDSDSLPEYDVLDAILAGYVDGDAGRAELVAAGHDAALVDRVLGLVDSAEYKRRQSAPGTKISMKAFGRDRRLPITNRFRER